MDDNEVLAVFEKRLACSAIPFAECAPLDCDTCERSVSQEQIMEALAVAADAIRFRATIVRCCRCKYQRLRDGRDGPHTLCMLTAAEMRADDFCSYGRLLCPPEQKKEDTSC